MTFCPRRFWRAHHVLAALLCLLMLLTLACAARQTGEAALVRRQGNLPSSGLIALHPAFALTPENLPLYQTICLALTPHLHARGLQVRQDDKPLPAALTASADRAPAPYPAVPGRTAGHAFAEQQSRPPRPAHPQGNAAPLRLSRYRIPESDRDLPASVMRIAPPRAEAVLLALAQQQTVPATSFPGPAEGHNPVYGTAAETADYALVIRFSLPTFPPEQKALPGKISARAHGFNDFVTAAGPVRGVGALGYGRPSPSAPPRRGYGATPGDYARGYEGLNPGSKDFWHREADFRDRNYSLHQNPPEYANPPQLPKQHDTPIISPYRPILPKAPLPGEQSLAASRNSPVSSPSAAFSGKGMAWSEDRACLLIMICYDLRPLRQGKRALPVWTCRVWHAAPQEMGALLPRMAVLGASEQSAPPSSGERKEARVPQ